MNRRFEREDHAAVYNTFRFEPPKEMIDIILQYLKEKIDPPFQAAVDVGCGTGHTTVVYAPYFKSVTGFDISEAQISQAKKFRNPENVSYKVGPAETLPLPDGSVQLITAGACLHWLDTEKFFAEAKRVLVSNGVLASFCQRIPRIVVEDKDKMEQLAEAVRKFHRDDIQLHRSSRIKLVMNEYQDLEFPFSDIVRKKEIKLPLTLKLSHLIGHFESFSTFQLLKQNNPDGAAKAIGNLQNSIMKILGSDSSPQETEIEIYFDYFLVLCRKAD